MSGRDRYAMLICSLPHPGPLFRATRPPLSRLRLNEYLRLLQAPDRADYDTVSRLLDWARQGRERRDADILRDAREWVPTLRNPLARELVEWRLGLRSVIAALRYRLHGASAPPVARAWGYGRWLPLITRHWHEPDFQLKRVYPWLGKARDLLAAGESVALERLLLEVVWQELARRAEDHDFDFEAVLIYCMRWEVIARWTRYQELAASTRFEHLVREALAAADLRQLSA
jgi:hypothetical protein